jgi:hypothetical protein
MEKLDPRLDPYGLEAEPALQLTPPLPFPSEIVRDLLHLVGLAVHAGLRPARAAAWRGQLLRAPTSPDVLVRCERRLRAWLRRHSGRVRAP